MTLADSRLLQRLASSHGILTAYYDVTGQRHEASEESMLHVLRLLGTPVASAADVPEAWHVTQQQYWQRLLEPVIVTWEGDLILDVRMPAAFGGHLLKYHLTLETGERLDGDGGQGSQTRQFEISGSEYIEKLYPLRLTLPYGYHRLEVELGGLNGRSLVISAPMKAWTPEEDGRDRRWGVFLPLYSLHREKSWGAGDFSDMESLLDWTGRQGGSLLGTLPLLAAFLKGNQQVSPYLPVSRLMWNEFYLEIENIPELRDNPAAREMISSPEFQREIRRLRKASLVDYGAQMAVKRRVLEALCRGLLAAGNGRSVAFHRFIAENGTVNDYARFMATCEKSGKSWHDWPERMRLGDLRDGDYDDEVRLYHAYVQWLAVEQMAGLAEKAHHSDVKLYMDMPVGLHPDGYDIWRHRDIFVNGVAVGAPADTVFTGGQNWGFPPLHPQGIRNQGYGYVIAYLRRQLQHAGVLRIDHVMGLHRLFCIPDGKDAGSGLYLGYRSDELYAIITLESRRHQSVIVGEDLGTVPPYVRPAMQRHGLQRMYVMQYEMAGGLAKGLHPVPANALASLNTHDMPPFASYWKGSDIGRRNGLGLLGESAARQEKKRLASVRKTLLRILKEHGYTELSEDEELAVVKACYSLLADSPACMLLVNLEDLWQETKPQNVPSTGPELPNWQRKAKMTLEQFDGLPQVTGILSAVNEIRARKRLER